MPHGKESHHLPASKSYELWLAFIKEHGVVFGIDHLTLKRLCETPLRELRNGKDAVIARAKAPVDEGWVEHIYHFVYAHATIPDENENADYRMRNFGVDVHEGMLVAEQITHVNGIEGTDVFGSPIPYEKSKQTQQIRIEGMVNVEKNGDFCRYTSKIDGVLLNMETGLINIQPHLIIRGSVDFSIGNLSSSHDIHIEKDVCAGFSIRSGGSIIIGGSVERNAQIEADRDIEISGGVFEHAHLKSGRNCQLRFAQSAVLEVRGRLLFSGYLNDSLVYVEGLINDDSTPPKNLERGSVAGGLINCLDSIELSSVGSSLTHTTLTAGYDIRIEENLQETKENQGLIKNEISRYLRKVNVDFSNPKSFLAEIEGLPAKERVKAKALLRDVLNLKVKLSSLNRSLEVLESRQNEKNPEACIKISHALFPDVNININHYETKVRNRLGPVFFMEKEGEIIVKS